MPSHKLTSVNAKSKERWLLEWDQRDFRLLDPEGRLVLEADIAEAHRAVDLSQALFDGTISIATPEGLLSFKQNRAALADLRQLIDAGLRADPENRAAMRRQALCAIPLGAVLFFGAGGLFGCYCWYARWAPDPPCRQLVPRAWVPDQVWARGSAGGRPGGAGHGLLRGATVVAGSKH